MLSPHENQEIREAVHREVAAIEHQVCERRGSYRYLCAVSGLVFYSHQPVGEVLREFPPRPR